MAYEPQPMVASMRPPQQVESLLEQRFHELASQWKEETAHFSSTSNMATHLAYQEIVQLGSDAIPLILMELEREPGFLFIALRELTGANPVLPEHRGKSGIYSE